MGKETEPNIAPIQGRAEPLLCGDRDYRGLKVVQAQALNLFDHFMSERSLGSVIQRYVGMECYSRNQVPLEDHTQRLGLVYGEWNGRDKDELSYSLLFEVDKAVLTAEPDDTFLSGRELGQELFDGGQLDHVVGFATADYQNFPRDVTSYLLQQVCRIYFSNPELRISIAAKRRLDTDDELKSLSRQSLDQGRLTRGLLPYSEEDTETLVRLWIQGVSMKGIAQEIGRTPGSVAFQVAKLEDLPSRKNLRKWTDEEVTDLVSLRTERHLTFAQIAEVLDRSERSVHHKLVEKGVISFHRKLLEAEEVQRLTELLADEYSWPAVLQKLSVDFPKGRTVGELMAKAANSDLRIKTEFQIKKGQLEQLLAEGLPTKVIADRLDVTKSSIGRWKKRLQAEKE